MNVFHFNSPPLLDDLVGAGLKFHHRRQVCGDSVGSPNVSGDDPVQRPSQLFNGTQAGHAVLPVAQRQYVLHRSHTSRTSIPNRSRMSFFLISYTLVFVAGLLTSSTTRSQWISPLQSGLVARS